MLMTFGHGDAVRNIFKMNEVVRIDSTKLILLIIIKIDEPATAQRTSFWQSYDSWSLGKEMGERG